MVDRVLEQRLHREPRHERVHRQVGDVPAHFEAVAESQRLDPLIDPRELELLLEAQRAMRVAQRRAEQVGEVLDRLLGAPWVAARERRDRVQAVEQEMRAHSRLQRLDPRARLGAQMPLPLVRDVEVAQQHRRDDHADALVAEQERPVLAREECGRDVARAEAAADEQRRFREQRGVEHQEREYARRRSRHGEAREQRARVAEKRRAREAEPLQKHRDPRELGQETGGRAREAQRDRDQLRDQHDRKHAAVGTEVGYEEGVERGAPRTRRRDRRALFVARLVGRRSYADDGRAALDSCRGFSRRTRSGHRPPLALGLRRSVRCSSTRARRSAPP